MPGTTLGWCAGLAAALALPVAALSQTPPPASSRPEIQAALTRVDAGDVAPLLKLADGGDAEAQYYAGLVYLFGRGAIAKDPPKGCGYEEKASATRGDAAHLVGMCYQSGAAGGAPDKAKAEAAFTKAAGMGFSKSKCALGQMLMSEPARAPQGLKLCEEAATAGDVEAQMTVAGAYFSGAGAPKDQAAARKWYEMAAKQNNVDANRRLGEMYARGDGGSKDEKKAMTYWLAAEKAGDPLVSILVADQLFLKMSGGRPPGPGTYAFKGGVPVADIQVVEEWYKQALEKDPRPDVQQRAKYALAILSSFKTAANSSQVKTGKKK